MSEISEQMVETTLELINKMFYNNEKINVSLVAKKGKISRQFIYNHKEITDRISFYQNFNSLSLQEKFIKLQSENKLLYERIERYDSYMLTLVGKAIE